MRYDIRNRGCVRFDDKRPSFGLNLGSRANLDGNLNLLRYNRVFFVICGVSGTFLPADIGLLLPIEVVVVRRVDRDIISPA